MRFPRSVAGWVFAASGVASGCSAPSGGGAEAPTAAPPVVTAPVERTSDRGERTLPVAPIGRIAPEVPPEASPGPR